MITDEEIKQMEEGLAPERLAANTWMAKKFVDAPDWTTDRARRLLEEVKRLRKITPPTHEVLAVSDERLNELILVLEESIAYAASGRPALGVFEEWSYREALDMLSELRRFRNGDLTPQELQNVCHNLHQKKIDCTRQEFKLGCDLMIEKLFGPEDTRTDLQKWADMHVEAAITARLQHQEEMAAAYLQKVGIPPEEAVLCEQTGADGVIRWWFERRNPPANSG